MGTSREKPSELEVWDFDETISNAHIHHLLVTEANRIGKEKGEAARAAFLEDEEKQWEFIKAAGVRVNDGGTGRLKQHFEESMKNGNPEISIATHSQFPKIIKRFLVDKEIGVGLDPQAVDQMVIVDGIQKRDLKDKNEKMNHIISEHEKRGVTFKKENVCLVDDHEGNVAAAKAVGGFEAITATKNVTADGPSHFDQLASRRAKMKKEAEEALKEEKKAEAKTPEVKTPEAEAKVPEAKSPEAKAPEATTSAPSKEALPFVDPKEKNHYVVLGVPPDAKEADIKKAYRKLALQHHPDKHNNSEEAKIIFQRLNEAHEVLTSRLKREAFDRELASAKTAPPSSSPPTTSSPETPEGSSSQNQAAPEDLDDFLKQFNFSFDAAAPPPSRGNVQSRNSIGQKDSQYQNHRLDSDPFSQHQIFRTLEELKAALKDFIDKNYQNLLPRDAAYFNERLNSLPSLSAQLFKIGEGEARLSQHQSKYGTEEKENFLYNIITTCDTRSPSAIKQSVNVVLPKEVEEGLKEEKQLAESKVYNALVFDVADKVIKNSFTETGCSSKNPPTIKVKLKDSNNPSPLELAYMQAAIMNDCPCVCKNRKGETLNVSEVLKSKGLPSEKAAILEAGKSFQQSRESEQKVDVSIHFKS